MLPAYPLLDWIGHSSLAVTCVTDSSAEMSHNKSDVTTANIDRTQQVLTCCCYTYSETHPLASTQIGVRLFDDEMKQVVGVVKLTHLLANQDKEGIQRQT